MIKKMIVFIFLSIISVFIVSPLIIKAESVIVEEPAANTGGLWHVEDGNRVYIHMRYTDGPLVRETGSVTNAEYPDYDYSNYTYWEFQKFYDNYEFPNTSSLKTDTIANPDVTTYDTFKVEIVANMTSSAGTSPSFKTVRTYTDMVVNEITVDLVDYVDPVYGDIFPYIKLTIDGEEILSSQRESENPYYSDQAFGVRMYWEKSDTAQPIDPSQPIDPDNPVDPWDALPSTTGNPENPVGDWGNVTNVSVNNQTISFDINYKGIIYPVEEFTVDGDLDFINKSNDILYYSDPTTGDRILYFNFGNTLSDAILTARSFTEINEWKGEALWNLTQDQIKVTDVLNIYNYIPEVDNDGNVYSYFYMPDVPIDNLISVSAVLAYRYYDDGFLGIGSPQPGDIQYKTIAAVSGQSSSVSPTWVESTYTTAYITGAVAAVATAAGVIPGYGWAIAGAAFLVGGVLNVSDVNEWFAYDVNQIDHVIPTASLVNDINNYITSVGGSDQFTAETDKLYKLHLAQLDSDHDDVEIMAELSNITQVVWESDGKIYVVNQENIADISWGGPGTLVPDITNNIDLTSILWVVGGIAALVMISNLKLDKKPGLLIIILGAVVYILYSLGIISW